MSATSYLLRWKGRQSGPLPPDEIRARLKRSEIGLMHEVQVDGQWVTVEKFLNQSAPRPPAAPAPKLEKKATPAPPKIEPPKPPAPPAVSLPPPVPLPPVVPPLPPEPAVSFTSAQSLETPDELATDELRALAGFWLRAVAGTIDGVILSALIWALAAVVLVISGASRTPLPVWLVAFVLVLYAGGSWLYFALLESSEIQATLGKLAVGLIVTDLDGGRITFTHATGRFFAKAISTVTLGVGFFMAAFTPCKQALHDLMAGCHVLLRLPPARIFQP